MQLTYLRCTAKHRMIHLQLVPICDNYRRHLRRIFSSETDIQLLDKETRADEFHLSLASTQLKLALQRKIKVNACCVFRF